jgi:hypothetical protein
MGPRRLSQTINRYLENHLIIKRKELGRLEKLLQSTFDTTSHISTLQDENQRLQAEVARLTALLDVKERTTAMHVTRDGDCPSCGYDGYFAFSGTPGSSNACSFCMHCGYNNRFGDQLVGWPAIFQYSPTEPTQQLDASPMSRSKMWEDLNDRRHAQQAAQRDNAVGGVTTG